MKLPLQLTDRRNSLNTRSAFTMVEVALSLAIVAFALVAIIGVMPFGMNVRKQNREDTIISQDVATIIEAIRSGASSSNMPALKAAFVQISGPTQPITGTNYTTADIVSRLCIPRWDTSAATNLVRAYFRAMSGNLGDVSGTNISSVVFRYVVTAAVTNYTRVSSAVPMYSALNYYTTNNLYEVKLTFQWPVFEPPPGQFPTNFGEGRLVMRTQVSGELSPVMNGGTTNGYLFQGANFLGQ